MSNPQMVRNIRPRIDPPRKKLIFAEKNFKKTLTNMEGVGYYYLTERLVNQGAN